MSFQIHSTQESIQLVHDLTAAAQGLFKNKKARTAENPHEILEGMHQLLFMVQQVEDGKTEDPLAPADITQIGDYGMQLLMNLYSWATNNEQDAAIANTQQVVITLADWIIRNDGLLQTLEPIVDTLAVLSNQNQGYNDLRSLCEFMARTIHACDDTLKNDLEQTNPGRPWRVLHLNYGITATRTHEPELMRKIFNEFAATFPQDAPQFFAEGMQEMERLHYPEHVRKVMQEYFDRWVNQTMH